MCCNYFILKVLCLRRKLSGELLEAIIFSEEIGRRRYSAENGSLGTSAFEIIAQT